MRTGYLTTTFIVISSMASFAGEPGSSRQSADRIKGNAPAIAVLDGVLKAPSDTYSEGRLSNLQDAAREVMALAPRNYLVRSRLSEALAKADQESTEDAAKELRRELVEARETLAFQVVVEAPRPKGFPEWTPVGEIRIQKYPPYRVARTKFTNGAASSFMTLFNHIASNGIEMTAPVEMSYEDAEAADLRARDMAFLYENTTIGQTGSTGKVDVADVPARTAISIGVRGTTSPNAVEAAQGLLKRWLAEHSDEYLIEGDLRVLGYNSPMIPEDKRYFEVQIPVREKRAGEPQRDSQPTGAQ